MGKESRTFLRIDTRLRAYSRRIDTPDSPPLFRGPSIKEHTSHKPVGAGSEAVLEMLAGINQKLDLILSTVSQDMLGKDFPMRLEITEISGAGVLFSTQERVTVGDHLEMILVLSQFPLRLASVCGTVERREEQSGTVRYAFNFKQIRENDRESIVQFVFKEQREQIRESKHAY
jgi:hypothetical protein